MKRMIMMLCLAGLLVMACGPKDEPAGPTGEAGEVPSLTLGHVGHDHQIALGVAALKPDLMKKNRLPPRHAQGARSLQPHEG